MINTDFILEARRLGITEDDVISCTSIYQLLNWQIEVSKDIANITGQIEMSSAVYHSEGNSSDPKRYARQRHAKRLLDLLCQRINVRVQELKHNSIVEKNEFAEQFVLVARQQLKADVFQELIEKTTKKL